MLMPSIFGEDLFDDLFDLPFYDDSKVEKKLYGRHAKNLINIILQKKFHTLHGGIIQACCIINCL